MSDQERMEKLISAAKELGFEQFFFVGLTDGENIGHTVQGFSAIDLLGILEVLKPGIIARGEGE